MPSLPWLLQLSNIVFLQESTYPAVFSNPSEMSGGWCILLAGLSVEFSVRSSLLVLLLLLLLLLFMMINEDQSIPSFAGFNF